MKNSNKKKSIRVQQDFDVPVGCNYALSLACAFFLVLAYFSLGGNLSLPFMTRNISKLDTTAGLEVLAYLI